MDNDFFPSIKFNRSSAILSKVTFDDKNSVEKPCILKASSGTLFEDLLIYEKIFCRYKILGFDASYLDYSMVIFK